MYTDALTGVLYDKWLDQVTSGARISATQPLDPFQTSMRRIGVVAESLFRISTGQTPIATDEQQRLVDLRAAGLVEDANLSDLGRNVVAAWTEHRAGVLAQGRTAALQEPSVLRNAILVREAVRLGVEQYEDYLQRWRALRKSFSPHDLIQNAWLLHAYSYYDRDVGGFNPWRVLSTRPLQELQPPLNPSVDVRQQRLDNAINNWANRATGRREFCAGMECFVLGGGAGTREFLQAINI